MKWDLCGTPLSFDISTPTLRESAARLAERARAENWSHEEYLAACLQREVSARESLEEFDFDRARGLKRDTIAHLGTLDFITPGDNAVFLGSIHRNTRSDVYVEVMLAGPLRVRRRRTCSPSAG